MDVLRKFGLYLVACAIIAGGGTFYFLRVHTAKMARDEKRSKIEQRRDELQRFARGTIPNDALIKEERIAAAKEKKVLDRCEDYVGLQARICHTRPFFRSEDPTHPNYGMPIDGEVKWIGVYERMNEQLRERLEAAGMSLGWTKDLSSAWGNTIPTAEQMQEAHELYWFQTDLAEILTDGTETAFQKLIDQLTGENESFPKTPADLVINFKPSRLDELLRNLEADKLEAVLKAIIINTGEFDLASIFDTYLSNDDPNKDFSWDRVRGLTMNDAQRAFLARVRPSDQPDLSYHQRFINYVADLRSVRYRNDVIGLLNAHGFEDVAKDIKSLTQSNRERIRGKLAKWNRTRLAQAIANVVSIQNDRDYKLVRENHKLKLAEVTGLTFSRPTALKAVEGRGAGDRPEGMPGEMQPDRRRRPEAGTTSGGGTTDALAKVTAFRMDVRLPFERIPVFLRGFLNNSWHYAVEIKSVVPVASGTGSRSAGGGRLEGRPGGVPGEEPESAGLPGRARQPRPGRSERAPAPREAEGETTVEPKKHAILSLQCEARQYTRMLEKIKQRQAEAAKAAKNQQ